MTIVNASLVGLHSGCPQKCLVIYTLCAQHMSGQYSAIDLVRVFGLEFTDNCIVFSNLKRHS
jgi:hypothetical protein